jgi:hypothetical protein
MSTGRWLVVLSGFAGAALPGVVERMVEQAAGGDLRVNAIDFAPGSRMI